MKGGEIAYSIFSAPKRHTHRSTLGDDSEAFGAASASELEFSPAKSFGERECNSNNNAEEEGSDAIEGKVFNGG